MKLTNNEKNYLKDVLKKELEHFLREKKTLFLENVNFIKAEEEYESFLKELIRKVS